MKQLNCVISFFQLHLMLYAYVRRFDVMDTVQNFLGTKQGLSPLTAVRGLQRPQLTPFSALQTGRSIV